MLCGNPIRLNKIINCKTKNALKRTVWLYIFSLFTAMHPNEIKASSVYIAETNDIIFNNDADEFTYIQPSKDIACKAPIIRDPANVYPWGKESSAKTETYSINDGDWKGKSLILVNRIKNWRQVPLEKLLGNKDLSATNKSCIRQAYQLIEKDVKAEKQCLSQGKSFRNTEAGRLCLSDFEYGQLKIMQDQKQNEQTRLRDQQNFERQQQERAFEEQNKQQRQESINRQREAALRMIMTPQQTRNCFGTSYNAAGMTTYNTRCY
jgi:hypothetical protein